MVSVLIITMNEESDIGNCIKSVEWSDDIHVFDSNSIDNTVSVAKKLGASVYQKNFTGFASQRNAALEMIDFKYEWIFILDADERCNSNLHAEIIETLQNSTALVSGFRIRRRDFLENKWLKHSQITPFYTRIIRRGKAKYHREINEVLEVDGEVIQLKSYFDHFPFSKGYQHWIQKHNIYSSLEASKIVDDRQHSVSYSLKDALFAKDISKRRYNQKGIFYKMPGRPFLKLLYMMFFRGALLDGYQGVKYSLLQAIYEYFIVIKTKEILQRKNSIPKIS